jgi:ferrochelatase
MVPDAVRPFLFNLFRDPAIIGAPAIIRYPIAALISTTREKLAKANYAIMGGGSPLLPETRKQAVALEAVLAEAMPEAETKCFIAMRYWKPLTDETAKAVKAWAPDEIVLLPLYPHYSTTTTGSSVKAWEKAYRGPGQTRTICCYPTNDALIDAHARLIRETYEKAGSPKPARLLFSAHGLPEKVILAGDPYQKQIEATAAAVAARLGEGWDWKVSYQSRVGPMKWIGPSTDDEVRAASQQGLALGRDADRLRLRAHRDPGRAGSRISRVGGRERLPRLYPGRGLGRRAGFHRGLAKAVVEALPRDGVSPSLRLALRR